MKELVEELRKTPNLCLGGKANAYHNIDARKYLAEEGFAVFPDEYFSFVKYINGMRSDDAQLYAILPDDTGSGFEDAVFVNEALNRADKKNIAVLGINSFDYLVYDATKKEYQLRDIVTDEISTHRSSFSQAIHCLFSI